MEDSIFKNFLRQMCLWKFSETSEERGSTLEEIVSYQIINHSQKLSCEKLTCWKEKC